jgi:hypothetical protein
VGSLNGTFMNREPVDARLVVNGGEIQIARFRLVFRFGRWIDYR